MLYNLGVNVIKKLLEIFQLRIVLQKSLHKAFYFPISLSGFYLRARKFLQHVYNLINSNGKSKNNLTETNM